MEARLEDKINEAIKQAMLAKEKIALEALRAVKKEFLEARTAKGAAPELSFSTSPISGNGGNDTVLGDGGLDLVVGDHFGQGANGTVSGSGGDDELDGGAAIGDLI